MQKFKIVLLLIVSLIIQSFASVFTKLAAGQEFLSVNWCLFYGITLLIAVGFSFVWQIILEHLPLSTAYLRKGITYILVLIWSSIFFGDTIEIQHYIGTALIVLGLVVNGND